MILKFIDNKRITFGWVGWENFRIGWHQAWDSVPDFFSSVGFKCIELGPIHLHIRPKG